MTLSTDRSFKFEDVRAVFMDDDDSGQDFTADWLKTNQMFLEMISDEDKTDLATDFILLEDQGHD